MGSGDANVHRQRRAAIEEEFPQVVMLKGPDSRTQYFAYLLVIFQAGIAYICRDSFTVALLLGSTISPYVAFAVLTLIHEVSHCLVFRSTMLNRFLGIFCNMVILSPVSEVFRQHHLMHHSHLGDVKKDVDVPGVAEMSAIGNSTIKKILWLSFSVFILPVRSVRKLPILWNRYMVLNWIVCLSFTASVFYLSLPAFLYLALGLLFSQSMHPANARQVQRHLKLYEEKGASEEKVCAGDPVPIHKQSVNTFSYYGIQNYLTLNVGFHVEHHDFGNIAWTRLPELRQIAGDKWYPQSKAYTTRGTKEIYEFISNPKISLKNYAGRNE